MATTPAGWLLPFRSGHISGSGVDDVGRARRGADGTLMGRIGRKKLPTADWAGSAGPSGQLHRAGVRFYLKVAEVFRNCSLLRHPVGLPTEALQSSLLLFWIKAV